MNASTIESLLRAARDEGIVPADAGLPATPSRPWPVVLLTALGAWLAAVPMLIVVGMLFGSFVTRDFGAYVVGAMLLAGAVVVLRSRDVPLFVEQLAVPALVAGLGTLGVGLFRDVGNAGGALALGVVSLLLGSVLRAAWLRALLGVNAAVLLAFAVAVPRWGFFDSAASMRSWWLALHVLLVPWLLVHAAQQQHRLRGHAAAMVESIGVGWGLALLAMLAWWAGMTFLVGGAIGGIGGEIVREIATRGRADGGWYGMGAVSAALALAAAVMAARRWPGLRHPALVGAGLVLVGLSVLMPSLGAVLLLLSLLVTTQRRLTAAAAGVAAAWIVGAFYYQLDWTLGTKAIVLAAAGALLLGLARWAGVAARMGAEAASTAVSPAPTTTTTRASIASSRGAASGRAWIGLAATVAAVLIVANVAIMRKERLIRDGRPVFVELAPADPRSLMQGDFMRLNFAMPRTFDERRSGLLRLERPRVVVQVDARGVATMRRIDRGEPLGVDELAIELTPKNGRWTLVTDAWFFAEGEAGRWQNARYGEFRVDANGRALLVNLRGAKLELL